MKKLKYYMLLLGLIAIWGCNDSESDLLSAKVYFESDSYQVDIEGVDSYSFELTTRISKAVGSNVEVVYDFGNEAMIESYNTRNGTNYEPMPQENISLTSKSVFIEQGDVRSSSTTVELKNLAQIKEGDTYLVPIIIKEAGLPIISESNRVFLAVTKPIVINKVYEFERNYLSVPLSPSLKFKSVTYEALIYANSFGWIKSVMGKEGSLLLRFGDTTIEPNIMQIAGLIQFGATTQFRPQQWYHIAFTYDEVSKIGILYVNGEKVADKIVDVSEFDINDQFFIGYAYDYDSSRYWAGNMSECRLWTVARTASQIKQNMLGVDPDSDGLLGYWKLSGDDYFVENDIFYVKDQTKNNTHAVSRRGNYQGGAGRSVEPVVKESKVNLK